MSDTRATSRPCPFLYGSSTLHMWFFRFFSESPRWHPAMYLPLSLRSAIIYMMLLPLCSLYDGLHVPHGVSCILHRFSAAWGFFGFSLYPQRCHTSKFFWFLSVSPRWHPAMFLPLSFRSATIYRGCCRIVIYQRWPSRPAWGFLGISLCATQAAPQQ